ncbi:MAG: DNA internalization-related competence protein ComEC/Rec2, partial [Deltaproteobacteria bacterium]|nr:DNA internalization-related competence protein ComEC/Rec2 [Deltaproteobacteria bacterium]
MIKDGLRLLLARPLLFLLPFFLTGLSLGPYLVFMARRLWPAAALATLVFALWTIRRYRFSLTAAAGAFFFLGLAITANFFKPPEDHNHVYQYRDLSGLIFGGQVTETPWLSFGRMRLIISGREVLAPGGKPSPVKGRIYLTVQTERLAVKKGDWVRFPTTLRKISGFSNPGGYNSQAYWASRGVWIQGYLKDPRFLVIIDTPGRIASPFALITAFRVKSAYFIDRTIAQPARGLMKTLLLGIRDDIEPEVAEAFRNLGLAHLLAISGLHIGLIAVASYWLCLKLFLLWPGLALRLNVLRLSMFVSLVPVVLYTSIAGGRPSTIRAAIMVGAFALAFLLGRSRDLLTTLATAAWIILFFQPGAVFSISFQLSFLAVGAIIILTPRISSFSLARNNENGSDTYQAPILGRLWGLTTITLAAFLGTAPIIAYYFNQFPLLALPANLTIMPLVTMITIPPGLLALIVAPVFPWAEKIILLTIERLLWVMLAVIEGAAAWPWANLKVPSPSPVFIIEYYLLLLSLFLIRPFRKAVLVSTLIIAICLPIQFWPTISRSINPQLKVTMLDVGQGSAAHVAFPDRTQMIIDGGGFRKSTFDTGENIIAPYLHHKGVTRLDVLVLSHAHPDHCGGLAHLAQTFHPKTFWSNHEPGFSPQYLKLQRVIEHRKIKHPLLVDLYSARRFGPVVVQVLHPPPDFLELQAAGRRFSHLNNNSLVLRIQFGKLVFLFPGDLEREGEAEIVSRQKDRLRADVLLACHHGGRTSMTAPFLKAVQPKHVVFSVGRYNRFN